MLARLRERRAVAAAPPPDLAGLCRKAWRLGADVPLEDCLYGPALARAPRYYRFLAGLTRAAGIRSVVELGTHCGGSIAAMSRALAADPDARLLTIDLRTFPGFTSAAAAHPVKRLRADILDPATAALTAGKIPRPDLLFVDFQSRPYSVLRALELYAARAPAFVVIDDIRLNPAMRDLWKSLRAIFGSFAYDATAAARRDDRSLADFPIGLGLIAWRSALEG